MRYTVELSRRKSVYDTYNNKIVCIKLEKTPNAFVTVFADIDLQLIHRVFKLVPRHWRIEKIDGQRPDEGQARLIQTVQSAWGIR